MAEFQTQEHTNDLAANTVAVHGRKMDANTLLNIPSTARAHGMAELRGKFKGCLAVVAGAGPSLDGSIKELKENYGKYLLIAVDRSLPPLLKAGIVPHLVCSADMDTALEKLYSGYRIPESVALVFDSDAYFTVPRAWKGPLITYDNYFSVGLWLNSFLGCKGFLGKNFTVAHTGLYVAATAGCSWAVLVEVDFAYPSSDKHHADGAIHFDHEAAERSGAHWLQVPGNVLDKVLTTEVFSACPVTMAQQIEETQIETINASPIGAKIERARYLPLAEALALPREEVDIQGRLDLILSVAPSGVDLDAFAIQSEHVILCLDKMLQDVTAAIDILVRLNKTDGLRNKLMYPKWKRVFAQAIRARDKMFADEFVHQLLNRSMQRSIRTMKENFKKIEGLEQENPVRLGMIVKNLAVLFGGISDNSKMFIECLQRVREDLGLDLVPTQWEMPKQAAASEQVVSG